MSEITEQKQVFKKTVVGHKCDNCGAIENDYTVYEETWFNYSRAHSGWGNDSCESYKYFDVCSPACFLTLGMKDGMENLEGYDSAEIGDMPWKFFKKLAETVK